MRLSSPLRAGWLPVGLAALALVAGGCGHRAESATPAADSTLAYASLEPGGVEAVITLCRKVGSKSGKRYGVGTVFTIAEGAKVRAVVDLANLPPPGARDLMFHLVWVGPGDKEFYTKRIDVSPDDAAAPLVSAVSIPPDRRQPGRYRFRVYLFRELIAEKLFELRAPAGEADAAG